MSYSQYQNKGTRSPSIRIGYDEGKYLSAFVGGDRNQRE